MGRSSYWLGLVDVGRIVTAAGRPLGTEIAMRRLILGHIGDKKKIPMFRRVSTLSCFILPSFRRPFGCKGSS